MKEKAINTCANFMFGCKEKSDFLKQICSFFNRTY